jgi:hypothetical protein
MEMTIGGVVVGVSVHGHSKFAAELAYALGTHVRLIRPRGG